MKKQSGHSSAFLNSRLLIGWVFCLTGTLLGIAVLCAAPDQSAGIPAGSNSHTSRNSDSEQHALQPERHMSAEEVAEAVGATLPTRGTFMARWNSVAGAAGYRLDVSTSNSFSGYLKGYENLDVGNTIGATVTGLQQGNDLLLSSASLLCCGKSGGRRIRNNSGHNRCYKRPDYSPHVRHFHHRQREFRCDPSVCQPRDFDD